MPKAFRGRIAMFEYQPPAVLNQANPVQNTWYDILPVTNFVRVYDITVNVKDTDETIEVQLLIDGETIQGSPLAATFNTNYFAYLAGYATDQLDYVYLGATGDRADRAFLIEGHSVQIQVRKTTVAGVGNLTGIVTYGVLTDVP